MSYFREQYTRNKTKIKTELDLCDYATQSDLKNATCTSNSAKKTDLSNLRSDINTIDIYKLETTSVDLRKLSYVVKHEVVKNVVCDKLVKNVNPIYTSGPVKTTDYDKKIIKIEGKIPSNTCLATTAALNTVKNELRNVSDLVTKVEYDDTKKKILLLLIIINL